MCVYLVAIPARGAAPRARGPVRRACWDKKGFHRRATNPVHVASVCFKSARAATFCHVWTFVVTPCHVLPHVAHIFLWKFVLLGGIAALLRRPRLSRPRPEAVECSEKGAAEVGKGRVSEISRIRLSPFYESLCDSSIHLWFKKMCGFVSSNWSP